MVSWRGARISLSRGSVLSREYFPSSFQIKYTEAVLSNSCTRKLLRSEITKMLVAVLKNKSVVSFVIIFGTLSFARHTATWRPASALPSGHLPPPPAFPPHTCLCHRAVLRSTGQEVVMPCGWEGNRGREQWPWCRGQICGRKGRGRWTCEGRRWVGGCRHARTLSIAGRITSSQPLNDSLTVCLTESRLSDYLYRDWMHTADCRIAQSILAVYTRTSWQSVSITALVSTTCQSTLLYR